MVDLLLTIMSHIEDLLLAAISQSWFCKINEGKGHEAIKQDLIHFHESIKMEGKNILWVHGASIGEVKCLNLIVKSFIKKGLCDIVLISYTSPDRLKEVETNLGEYRDRLITLPLLKTRYRDLVKLINHIKLLLTVVAEKDYWFKIFNISREYKAPVIVTDGQLKDVKRLLQLPRHFLYLCLPSQGFLCFK